MPQQARSFITRDRIIESAALVFDRHGYAGATLSDIVRQSGTTKGALYFHFQSKEEVAIAVVETQHARSATIGVTPAGVRGLEMTIRACHLLGHQIVTDPLVRAGIRLTLEQGSVMAVLASPYKEWIDLVNHQMEQAVADGDVGDGLAPETVASFLVGSFTGIQLLSSVTTGRTDLPQRLRELWELVLPAFVPARKLPHFRRINAIYASPHAPE